jgi:alcohol dehydrogenase YqhD (iron-dependent ADH family)
MLHIYSGFISNPRRYDIIIPNWKSFLFQGVLQMQSFTFYSPTEVVFGRGAELKTVEEVKKFGGTRALVVYGGGSVVRSGLLGRIEKQLEDAGISYGELGGVQPNPRLSLARAGVEKALEMKADMLLAVGGGSAIDTAKAIALGAFDPSTDIWSYWTGEAEPSGSLPLGAVLTISAAGSETSDSAVLTDEATGSKRGLSTDWNRPKFAIMNPELTFTLPKYQLGCGIVDIMMHTLDRYFSPVGGNEFSDQIAEALLRVTVENGRLAMKDPRDYDAMSELMWCGSVSHNGLTGLGGAWDFATHQLGHELSAMFDAAHGASLSAVWGSWAGYVMAENPERFARYAQNVWGIGQGDARAAARAGIEATVAYFKSIEMPTCFSELGIGVQGEDILRDLAGRCSRGGTRLIGSFRKLAVGDMYNVYKLANR